MQNSYFAIQTWKIYLLKLVTCPQCSYTLDEEGSEVFDNIVEIEPSLTIETKIALVYIAGYVTRKDKDLSKTDMMEVL